jgi:hypothetical protein
MPSMAAALNWSPALLTHAGPDRRGSGGNPLRHLLADLADERRYRSGRYPLTS